MGALGCSVGPAPSWVVCAIAPSEKAPDTAKTKTAKFARNRFFISHLLSPIPKKPKRNTNLQRKIRNCNAKLRGKSGPQVVCYQWGKTKTTSEELEVVDHGRKWWFSTSCTEDCLAIFCRRGSVPAT
jgi:hypothetical protein